MILTVIILFVALLGAWPIAIYMAKGTTNRLRTLLMYFVAAVSIFTILYIVVTMGWIGLMAIPS